MDRRSATALLLAFAPFVTACMPATPETVFSWDVNDRMPPAYQARAEVQTPRPAPRTYAYESSTPRAAAPAPKPQHYANAAPPVHYHAVSYEPLPPPSAAAHDGSIAFIWPAHGRIISSFGKTLDGERNDGINIATAMDAPIHAAAGGTVTYAGNELKGYGNLVLIRHADGYTTAYAHADRLTVQRGDTVTKGQVIGYAGTSGDVDSPQLHFEIRHDTTPLDPRTLLVASNS